jgi:hypothetical protein
MLVGTPAALTEVFHGFPQPLDENTMQMPQIGNACVLPNPFQYIRHLPRPRGTEENHEKPL